MILTAQLFQDFLHLIQGIHLVCKGKEFTTPVPETPGRVIFNGSV